MVPLFSLIRLRFPEMNTKYCLALPSFVHSRQGSVFFCCLYFFCGFFFFFFFLVLCGETSFPGSCGKEPAYQCRKRGFDPWVRKIPWRRKWQPTPVFLPGKFHGQSSLMDYSPWDFKELDMAKPLNTHTQEQYYRNTEYPDFFPFIPLCNPVHLENIAHS